MRNAHESDAAMLAELPNATSFVTSIFVGSGEYAKHESPDLVTARAVGQQMADHYRNGRKALVYAQLPSGRQFLVPDSYVPDSYQPTEKENDMTTMKTYNKKSNAKRAAESLAKRVAGFTAGDPVDAGNGEWFPNLIAPQRTIDDGVPDEVATVACVNGAPYAANPAPAVEPAKPVAATKAKSKAKRGRAPKVGADGMPVPPDFSAKTHERYRPKLAAVVALVKARDIKGLKAFNINPNSTSPKAIMRYRDAAIAALSK